MIRLFTASLFLLIIASQTALAFEKPPAAEVVKKVRRSVIRINSGVQIDVPVAFQAGEGGGSGVVFQINYDDGTAYAVTNHHVSGRAPLQSVAFWNGIEYKAEMIATEPGIDAALLKISGLPDERNLPDSQKTYIAAPLGDSDKVQIGDYCIAMGSPGSDDGVNANRDDPWGDFLLQQTVTMRVVTGKDTEAVQLITDWAGWRHEQGFEVLTNLPWRFRVSAAINGGNSGGPSFNSRGEVIGLNHAGVGPQWAVLMQNSNYTIPINFVKNFVYQVLNTGKYEIPWIGFDILVPQGYVQGSQIEEFAEKMYDPKVARVLGVRRESPAAKAGLRQSDVIVQFDGMTFPTNTDLRLYVFSLPIGKQVPIVVKRGARKMELLAEVVPKRTYDSEFSF
jgi:serine protease Do